MQERTTEEREFLNDAYTDYISAYDRETDDREPLSREDWERIHGNDFLRDARRAGNLS